jgi:hypothetical protein
LAGDYYCRCVVRGGIPHNTGAGMVRSRPPLQRFHLLTMLCQQSFNQLAPFGQLLAAEVIE